MPDPNVRTNSNQDKVLVGSEPGTGPMPYVLVPKCNLIGFSFFVG